MSKEATNTDQIPVQAEASEESLKDGLSVIEMEERLEMVQVAASAAEQWCKGIER